MKDGCFHLKRLYCDTRLVKVDVKEKAQVDAWEDTKIGVTVSEAHELVACALGSCASALLSKRKL